MASVSERLGVLEEKVTNHIKFFWVVVGAGFLWLGALSTFYVLTNRNLSNVAQLQADAPSRVVISLLGQTSSREEAETRLSAAASVIQSAKVGSVRPDAEALKSVSDKLATAQGQYPELPQVWEATAAFVTYKSEVSLPPNSKIEQLAKGRSCTATVTIDSGLVYKDCEVSLEDAARQFGHNLYNGKQVPFVFENSIVHYYGGEIPKGPMRFLGCLLIFDVPNVPPPNALAALRTLTAANLSEAVEISG
jgi:hypothetical protein